MGRLKQYYRDPLDPDDIFLDSSNLPGHDSTRLEGRVERPVAGRALFAVGVFFALVLAIFGGRAFWLQVAQGTAYADISRNNTLESSIIFATRGTIFDRDGRELAWNELQTDPVRGAASNGASSSASSTFALRKYSTLPGLSHVVGWVRYPKQDSSGAWWRTDYSGMAGAELEFDDVLVGTNGNSMIESDARGKEQRENIVTPPVQGSDIHLSIDAGIQSKLYSILSAHVERQGFQGGAAVIMDSATGQIIALTSFPEYDNQAFTDGDSNAVSAASQSARTPLLDRAIQGLYAPGSIVKPIFAAAALHEHLISPDKTILSTGAISVPNPYDPEHPSLFRDWTAHGEIDMRTAIAVSSDEYFYTIGGGFGEQRGLGIAKLDHYARLFGLSKETGVMLPGEQDGVIPTPQWKAQVFGADDPWRIGDTYHTAIGQYGFQITPIQAAVFIAAIANGGKLLTPQIIASSTPRFVDVGISQSDLQVVREGMRLAVASDRKDVTVKSLYIAGIKIAAKTGTAQIGAHNEWVNSWSVGFWPADHPRYAYAVVLEKGKAGTLLGAAPALVPFFEWLVENHPEYVN
ncbi:hypothetical protein HY968_03795 [Candidatus Kaiserbacteria bacterium]|nr:hypothetical protein [Candidatus Kaiserbacteria bacterium]